VLAYRIEERSSLRPMSRPACRQGQDPPRISEHTSSRERITGRPGSTFVESTATRRMGHGGGESEDGKAGEVRRRRSVQRLARGLASSQLRSSRIGIVRRQGCLGRVRCLSRSPGHGEKKSGDRESDAHQVKAMESTALTGEKAGCR